MQEFVELEEFFREHPEFTVHRKRNYRQAFNAFAKYTDHPFSLSRSEFLDCLGKLDGDYAAQSWNVYVGCVRSWYKWRYGGGEEYPEAVRKIKLKRVRRSDYVRRKIISEQEINALLRAADNPRDRALISFYLATGVRLSEALTVRLRDVEFLGNNVLKFTVSGKTGPYPTALVAGGYAMNILAWLNHHPFRDNPDAPLWVKRRGAVWECISDNGVYFMVRRLAKRAGIKRRIHPHMFRHTQSSEEAKSKIPMSTRKRRHGWSENSTMPNIYEHLTDIEGDEAYLEAFGVEKPKRAPGLFGLVECMYCHEKNPVSNKFCSKCGTVLSKEEAEKIVERQRVLDWLFKKFKDLPEE